MPGPEPGRDRIFYIAWVGPGFNFFYCRAGFFSLPGPGRDRDFLIAGIFLLPGPGLGRD